jgi:hypothetical protein
MAAPAGAPCVSGAAGDAEACGKPSRSGEMAVPPGRGRDLAGEACAKCRPADAVKAGTKHTPGKPDRCLRGAAGETEEPAAAKRSSEECAWPSKTCP